VKRGEATFLLLARKAAAIRRGESVPSWLYGVALRLALKSRISDARRRMREKQAMHRPSSDPLEEATWSEVRTILDEELAQRRVDEEARGHAAWTPHDREREVSLALQAYAALTTSANRGAVRDISQIQIRRS
jgi:DNA-directed RNA polymerase specialized sigma24 family protein